ncbi:MAG: acetate--CoA ligase [Flavobacteriaceae bacterium]|jgi:acetyl-CoA synthetase|nr:acetate--CoA ligase [Flavobacteriaceae bacterium]
MSMYQKEFQRSILDPNAFWAEQAKSIKWFKEPSIIHSVGENGLDEWYKDGKVNMSYLCIDKHIEDGYGEETAIIYDSPVTQTKTKITYNQLKQKVEKLAGGLRKLGVEKGDVVIIYMPMIPQAIMSMMACARFGAIHSFVFGGFAPKELATRVDDCKPKVIISATSGIEVDRIIPYKPMVDEAISLAEHKPNYVVLYNRKLGAIAPEQDYDVDFNTLINLSEPAPYVEVESTHPLFILYTSGTTGKPKGVVHDTGGYAVALKYTMSSIYDSKPGDVFWAASDFGWIVGHSYIVYAPMVNRNATIVYEGKPVKTPDAGAFWRAIEEYQVRVFFSAPTAFRVIRKEDPMGELIKQRDISCLKYLFVAGERCDAATLEWLQEQLQIPVVDHWWQTETAWAIMGNFMGYEGGFPVKPGSAGMPVPGYDVQIVGNEGELLGNNEEGAAIIKLPLPPGTLTTLWKAEERYKEGYLSQFPGYYFTGDGAYKDEDGYFFITGRLDDVINVAGHRLSTSEMEEVIARNPQVAECAAMGIEDAIKGQVPFAVVVTKGFDDVESFKLEYDLKQSVRKEIGAIASISRVVQLKRLPKTRSGKVLRRLIRNVADGKEFAIPSTIEDPTVIDEIIHVFKEEGIGVYGFGVDKAERNIEDLVVTSTVEYEKFYDKSLEKPQEFWGEIAKTFSWKKQWDTVFESDFEKAEFKWFLGGKLNITENCLDRHLEKNGDKTAILFEPNEPNEPDKSITYKELHKKVCKLANVLKAKGIQKGDKICIYMPMIPELQISILACARIGAVHTVVFAGYSSKALAYRIKNSESKLVITADGTNRGTKFTDLKSIVDEALENLPSVESVIVYNRTQHSVSMKEGRDESWEALMENADIHCPAEEMDAEDILFIIYSSESSGQPKGVVHTCGGYMVYAAYTFKNVFQIGREDVHFCTADIGWLAGHTYGVYAPLLTGITSVLYEGAPSYPNYGRFWNIVEKYKVTHFYTAPTIIRTLETQPQHWVEDYDLSSLKVLGSVGEPLNEEAWHWYNEKIGREKCPIVDTWYQTEAGGIMISAFAGVTPTKATYATKPFLGIDICLVDDEGNEITDEHGEGSLCIKNPWPGMARTIYGNHEKYKELYFSSYAGKYFTGDVAIRDIEGNYKIIGRLDDIIVVSDHRLSTSPIESVIDEHTLVTETAIVGYPHEIKGNALYAFVVTYEKPTNEEVTRKEIQQHLERTIGGIVKPDKIQFVSGLPRTRNGKITKGVLQKIALGEVNNLGDISDIINPEILDEIIKGKL